jgi:hypothetical protein
MRQFDKQHAMTLVAAVAITRCRFVSYAGGVPVASGAGGATDVAGVAEHDAAAGEALSVVTGFSYLVESGAAINAGQFVKPGADGVAVVGTITDNCGRALTTVGGAGRLVEVRLQNHVHP